jgi:ribosomal-protein-alanine N-acetyltransferase
MMHTASIISWLGYTPDLCLVAEIDGRIAGDMISRIMNDKAELASLAIHPDFRRRGVGSALLEETIRRVKYHGIGYIDLEVRKTNLAGFRFWEKMGFTLIGEQPGFYDDGEAALQMRKIIK